MLRTKLVLPILCLALLGLMCSCNQHATAPSEPAAPPTGYPIDIQYPNPFNPSTTIRFEMAEAGEWTVEVLDVHGNVVWTTSDYSAEPGIIEFEWDGKGFPEGVYFYRAIVGEVVTTGKMMLLR